LKSFLISDNRDTFVGMRLAGVNGVIVHSKEEASDMIKKCISDNEIGVLILTEKIVDMLKDEVTRLKLKSRKPLIIEIPDRHGTNRGYDTISTYIKESVGIKI
jgi:V/A-type H+-transporting ATPase subunit F